MPRKPNKTIQPTAKNGAADGERSPGASRLENAAAEPGAPSLRYAPGEPGARDQSPRGYGSAAALVTAFIVRAKREIAFGILLFIITLSPVYNIIPIASPFAERYLYLPTTGAVIVIGAIISYIFETYNIKKAKNRSICVILLFFSLMGIYSLLTVRRNTIWKDDSSLWSYTVMKRPNNSFAHNNLGIVFADQHRHSDAIIEFQAAIKVRPDNQTFHYNLGNAYIQQKRYFEAIGEFKRAIEIKPDFSDAHHELGFAYDRLGKNEEAIQEYRIALDINPFDLSLHNSLGVAYANQGDYGMAIKENLVIQLTQVTATYSILGYGRLSPVTFRI